MNYYATLEPQRWPRRRWALMVFALMGLQLALIFWLSGTKLPLPPPVAYGPKVYLPADPAAEWPGVSDPAQFVLANRRGFSGAAWMKAPRLEYDLPTWKDEQVLPLQLPVQKLGAEAGAFLRTNLAVGFEPPPKPQPDFDTLPPEDDLGNPHSALTVEGDLANRPLLSDWKLESQPDNEILTNSEVSVAVDARGQVFSAVLLASCGAKGDTNAAKADISALRLANSARFQPLPASGPGRSSPASNGMQWGQLIFHWHTVPLAPPTVP